MDDGLQDLSIEKDLNPDIFIGFTDENVEGQWEWINGESVIFSNSAPAFNTTPAPSTLKQ